MLSFLSPCVIPLVPGYISFISGLSLNELTAAGPPSAARRAGTAALAFVLGFSAVFVLMGASASAIGSLLRAHTAVIGKVAGAVIVLFGLHLTGVLPLRWLYYEKRLRLPPSAQGVAGAFLMGLAFAFGWTPCIGPILAGILALAASEQTVARGMALLAVYSLGLGIPFLLTALFVGRFLALFNRYKRFVAWGERAAGALLIAIGLLIFSNRLTALLRYVPEFFFRFSL